MAQEIQDLSNWLESHKGETLVIQKGEVSTGLQQIFDTDQVTLELNHISIVSNNGSIDDYIPEQELILHGQGIIRSSEGTQDLPQNAFEIPLFGQINLYTERDRVKLETEKAIYTIALH